MFVHIVLLFFPILYNYFIDRQNFFEYFSIKQFNISSFKKSIKLFLMLLLISFFLSLLMYFFGIKDLSKVSEITKTNIYLNPSYFVFYLFFAVFVEEFFFRSFLVKKIGIFFSSLLFALLHYGYGSYAEIIGAFVLGSYLAYYFKKNDDLLINYLGHLFYNIIVIITIMVV